MIILRDWNFEHARDYLSGRGLSANAAIQWANYLTRDDHLTCRQDADALLDRLAKAKASLKKRRDERPTFLTTPDEDFGTGQSSATEPA